MFGNNLFWEDSTAVTAVIDWREDASQLITFQRCTSAFELYHNVLMMNAQESEAALPLYNFSLNQFKLKLISNSSALLLL